MNYYFQFCNNTQEKKERKRETYKKKEEKKKGRRREGSILLHDSDLQEANEVRETFKIIYN